LPPHVKADDMTFSIIVEYGELFNLDTIFPDATIVNFTPNSCDNSDELITILQKFFDPDEPLKYFHHHEKRGKDAFNKQLFNISMRLNTLILNYINEQTTAAPNVQKENAHVSRKKVVSRKN
jgi:uncharacterized UPF0160 family protein